MSRRKLLLADDSVTIQKVVNLTFADEGIDVVTVGDGDTAMERIAEFQPDLVLADVNMPGLTGYQICEMLRGNEATRDMPVVLLVGSFEPFDEAEAERVGANAFLTKPFQSIRQLVAQVSDLMESAAARAAETNGSHAETSSLPDDVSGTSPEADDIDSLYRQSFSNIKIADEEAETDAYSDVGMDDEIIETTYASGVPESQVEDFDTGRVAEIDGSSVDVEGPPPAAVFASAFETREEPGEGFEPISDSPVSDLGGWELEHSTAPTEEPQTENAGYAADAFQTHTYDTQSLDSSAVAETERDEPGTASDLPFDETIRLPEPPLGQETVRMDRRFDTTSSATFEFDEMDLLEVPSLDSGKTIEITTPLNAIEAGSNKQVVSLAPELIEMIAQRVVEKLSEKY